MSSKQYRPHRGVTVDIVDINASDHGQSCEAHKCCSIFVEENTIESFKAVQLERKPDEANPEIDATAIAGYHISGCVDS